MVNQEAILKKPDTKGKILVDAKANGDARPWKERKMSSVNVSTALMWGAVYELGVSAGLPTFEDARQLYDAYRDVNVHMWLDKKSDKMYDCGETLEFAVDADGNKHLQRAWFCKDRLCPMCNWRRSIKLTGQVLNILQAMQNRGIKGRPILLTLTMRNVKGPEISQSFSAFAEGFHRLTKYKPVKGYLLGAIRSSEITYNQERDDYNTHIHCLLWMSSTYFKDGYLSKDKWAALWQRAAKLDYTPVVDVRKVNRKPTEQDPIGYINAVAEVTKYTAKPTVVPGAQATPYRPTLQTKRQYGKRIAELERGMYRKRLISFFGVFKELHKELDLDDPEDGDLIGADDDGDGTGMTYDRYSYDYTRHNYYRTGHDGQKVGDGIIYSEDTAPDPEPDPVTAPPLSLDAYVKQYGISHHVDKPAPEPIKSVPPRPAVYTPPLTDAQRAAMRPRRKTVAVADKQSDVCVMTDGFLSKSFDEAKADFLKQIKGDK